MPDDTPRPQINSAKLRVGGGVAGAIFTIGSMLIFLSGIPAIRHLNMAAIGVIIDCKVRNAQPAVNVDCSFENSSVADKQPNLPPGYPPVIRTIQSHVSAVL